MDVSVIIPTYRSSLFIERTIDSVQSATGDLEVEVILVDDCSEDIEELKKVVLKYDNVLLLKKNKKSNAAISRNLGIEAANGQVIFLLDSDDAFEKNHIKKRVLMHQEKKVSVIFGAFVERDEQSFNFIDYIGKNSARDYLFIHDGDFRTSTISMTRKIYMDGGLNKHQDWGLFIDIDDKGFDWIYDDDPSVVMYVNRGTNMSSSANKSASNFFIQKYLIEKKHVTGFCKRQFLSAIVSKNKTDYVFFSDKMTMSCLPSNLKLVKLIGDIAAKHRFFNLYCSLIKKFRKRH